MQTDVRPPPRGEDLPYSDGEPMETYRHFRQMMLLVMSLNDAWRDRRDFYVGGNMFVYFSETQAKRNDFRGPDVFVVMDTERRERKSWVVWEENGRTPDVVIELLSASTEHVDRGEKMRIYASLLHVSEYYLFDPFTGLLEGFELDPSAREYRPRTAGADGRFFSRATGLFLGVVPQLIYDIDAPWLRWIAPDGTLLPTDTERGDAAEALAEAARAHADAVQAHADAAKAEADAAKAEADAAKAEADAAKAEADAAKAKLLEYERRFGRL